MIWAPRVGPWKTLSELWKRRIHQNPPRPNRPLPTKVLHALRQQRLKGMQAIAFRVHALGQSVPQMHLVLQKQATGGGAGSRIDAGVLQQLSIELAVELPGCCAGGVPDDGGGAFHSAGPLAPCRSFHCWNWAWSRSTGCRRSRCLRAARSRRPRPFPAPGTGHALGNRARFRVTT